jgi:class 3 adenylate cyclase/predicted negative regulator of RcsB-dependent stress response
LHACAHRADYGKLTTLCLQIEERCLKRKIAVILAADIAGYSRLIAEDEEETLRRFEGYRAVFEEFVERGAGRIFNTAGDAILAEFQSAVEAVRCAVDVQESLKARNLAYPPSRHMNFRIGITIGDVVEREGGDLLGDGVNIAARLESVAPPGGICVSRSVHEAVSGKIGLRFADAGPQALKNIPERVHAYTLTLDDEPETPVAVPKADPPPPSAAARSASPKAQPNWLSIVLALMAIILAGVYAYEYLPDEVLEKVGLARERPLDLNSDPATTAEVKPEPAPVSPPPQSDPPAKIEPEPTPPPEPERKTETPAPTPNVEPQPEPKSARTPPNPLASRYVLTRQWKDCQNTEKPDEAEKACNDLLETGGLVDEDYATIHFSLGRALRDKGETDQAIEHYNESIKLNPTADAFNHRGVAFYDKGDFKSAIDDYTEALRLAPSNADAINNRAWTRYKAGDLATALQDANRAVELDGNKAYIFDTRGHIHEARGSRNAAISDYRKALSLDGSTESSTEGLRRLGVN